MGKQYCSKNTIPHIRSSKKKPSYENILSYIEKSTASNIDWSIVESACSETIANVTIDKDLKFLISSSCKSDAAQNEHIDFAAADESDAITPQKAPIKNQVNILAMKNNRIMREMKIKDRKIVKLSTSSKQKSYFMKSETSFYDQCLKRNKSNRFNLRSQQLCLNPFMNLHH